MVKKLLVAAGLFLGALGTSAAAGTITIDFDGDFAVAVSSATPIEDGPFTFTEGGLKWRASATPVGGPGYGAALFDTTCGSSAACGGDLDLKPRAGDTSGVSGNILINQDNRYTGPGTVPDDEARTTALTLTLLSDVRLIWTGVSVVDDGTYQGMTTIDGFDALVGPSELLPEDSDTADITFMSEVLGINDSVTVLLTGADGRKTSDSGGADSFTFSVVPLPASSLLLMAGLGGLAALRRRKKA